MICRTLLSPTDFIHRNDGQRKTMFIRTLDPCLLNSVGQSVEFEEPDFQSKCEKIGTLSVHVLDRVVIHTVYCCCVTMLMISFSLYTFDVKYSSKFRFEIASLSNSDWLILRGVPISTSALSRRKTRSSKSPDDKTYSSYSKETLFLQE